MVSFSLVNSIIETHEEFIQASLVKNWELISQHYADQPNDHLTEDFLSSRFKIFSRSDFVADTLSRNTLVLLMQSQ